MDTLHYIGEGKLGTWIRIVETLFDGPIFEFGVIPSIKQTVTDGVPAAQDPEHDTVVNLFSEKN